MNPLETVYRFLTQLLAEVKRYDAVLLATLEEGMHQSNVLAAMEQVFDGVMELRYFEEGLRIFPLLRIRKIAPGYFRFSFVNGRMEIGKYGRRPLSPSGHNSDGLGSSLPLHCVLRSLSVES
ncbi:MAG TPA: hypothetical protein VNA15_09490 [Candidatus Angelobacter sp.]|nr:hypothetical protein [Candidatus Angelobacter sp.]